MYILITIACLFLLISPIPLLRYLDGYWREFDDYVFMIPWTIAVIMVGQIATKI